MSTLPTDLTVVCYARPSHFVEPIDTHIETLKRLQTNGHIETLLVRAWPETLSLDECAPSNESLATFKRFQAWADRAGVSISPPFEQVSRTSTITNECHEVLRMPLLCVALYLGDTLTAVYPHTDGEQTMKIPAVIDRLRTGELPELPERIQATLPDESSTLCICPECGNSCLSGQGIYACLECRWVAGTTPAGHYQSLPTLRAQWTERATTQLIHR